MTAAIWTDHSLTRSQLEEEERILSAYLREERREASKLSRWYFYNHVLWPETAAKNFSEEFHRPIVDARQKMGYGEWLWTFFPRFHRKSYLLTIGDIIYDITHDINIRIALVGAREEIVEPWAILIRSAFTKGDHRWKTFQETYPELMIEPGDRAISRTMMFAMPRRTIAVADPTFRATYLGAPTGSRADCIHFDDCVEPRNTTTPEMSAKTMKQMWEFLPILERTGKYNQVIGAGTFHAYHDPYQKICAIGSAPEGVDAPEQVKKAKKFTVIIRHALEDPNISCDVCPKHIVDAHPHGRPTMDGHSIAPPVMTREIILDIFNEYKVDPALGETAFWHQMMNVCMSPDAQKIKKEWIIRHPTLSDWPVVKRRVLVIDDASKDFQKIGVGDFSVAKFGSFDDMGRLMKVYGLRSNRWTRNEFIQEIISWCRQANWWPHIVAKEKVSVDAFLKDVEDAFIAAKNPVYVVPVPRGGGSDSLRKADLIVSNLQGPYERREIVCGAGYPKELFERDIYELTNLGQVAHDDAADAERLFFVSEVRITNPQKHAQSLNSGWRPPSMANYGTNVPFVMGNRRAGVLSPLQTALESAGLRSTLAELGFSDYNAIDGQAGPVVMAYEKGNK